ncbi:hypothetical protein MCA1043 [Methylococcus capsulatus str. Bath]|uniref:Uncharacterized protein n=1 Tax=Methylococcus capsulatus (strain ATCC 33009 / NCIMB 11132 / Bath) TaxID=243233 RepID=Q60A29_METCA|nr:hypothetical protein MCA1043 [Methylococcus capsulatus str. Bath]
MGVAAFVDKIPSFRQNTAACLGDFIEIKSWHTQWRVSWC